ncbi:MAG: polysaccharide pyruvyl transferase family protein [Oscillospiraceae bacterium]|nr:polysaccharide pyruvyl transferase family protein [Oscillospiraceae bacterium]
MIGKIKKMVLDNKATAPIVVALHKKIVDIKLSSKTKKQLKRQTPSASVIFYLGIPAHTNLGDLAQGVCIRRWLTKNYPDTQVIEIETNALVNTRCSVLKKLTEIYKKGDLIVFQSGYTTTDLGGYADEMHQAVMSILPEAKMLMLPQTIFFKNKENQMRTAQCYNSMKHLLFLARDRVSYDLALNMFPDIPVKQFPDIVTTLIGNYTFNCERNGILFCCRNDGEKYYSDDEIGALMNRCAAFCRTEKIDTTKQGKVDYIVSHAEEYINREIETYSQFEAVITDRYHGTIFSLVAGTPVIIIKTNDHKVTTGAEWFHGVYDEYVYLANSLEDAYEIAKKVCVKNLDHKLSPYFECEYYDKLPVLLEDILWKE